MGGSNPWRFLFSKHQRHFHHQHQYNLALEKASTIPYLGKGVQIGQYATMERMYNTQDVEQFGKLIQDSNPLHSSMDWNKARGNANVVDDLNFEVHQRSGLIQFLQDDDSHQNGNSNKTVITCKTKPLVHGMLVASIFSSIFSILAPGCIYMNQSLDFAAPVFVNETVIGKVEIEKIRKWRKGGIVVQCATTVSKESSRDIGANSKHTITDDVVVVVKGVANVWLPNGYKK
eukprot:CAMPEP_0178831222 /NCGR_PEP_ID=MMETSP0746-20121128/9338_1 /TAXON_ID=913974 /ORGANISM="Nitzschia punctata, Strain CCMP561" /LENGTH=230 /DNA_ID=CAMNT_0020493435 /DNA_START=937 /DNA_END=1629 /DNA_ORIENTATION=+